MKLLNQIFVISVIGFSTLSTVSHAEGQFYLKPYLGFSGLSDQSANTSKIGTRDGAADFTLESGIVSGLGLGYRYSENLAAEIAWEYRTNSSETTLADGTTFSEGNCASNLLYLNGYYFLKPSSNWNPYLGAGLGWVQEIDIDFEGNNEEQSYTGEGGVAFQLIGGLEYKLKENIRLNAEARYSSTTADLEGEDSSGSISDLDYTPFTLQLGLSFYF